MMTMDAVGAGTSDGRSIHVFGRDFPRDLFMARLFYLLYFASFGSLFPLLAVYFKQLGMTGVQAGILLGCRPLVEFVAGPFWGIFAERFRKGSFPFLALKTQKIYSSFLRKITTVIFFGSIYNFNVSNRICSTNNTILCCIR